jgi:hypothetical protein
MKATADFDRKLNVQKKNKSCQKFQQLAPIKGKILNKQV